MQMHFAGGIGIHIFLICYFYICRSRFSGCCGPAPPPPLLNECGEDTATFTLLKYSAGLLRHPPRAAVNRTLVHSASLLQHHIPLPTI